MPSVNTPEDQAIIRYLLGDLDDSETERIEERYFCDSSFEEHIGAVEDLLIRDFLDGSLSTPDVELFQRKYLKVPELREKVAFAHRLRTAATSGHKAGSRRFGKNTRRQWVAMIAPPAFAAVGLICLVFSWIVVQNSRHSGHANLLPPKSETTRQDPVSLEQMRDLQALSAVLLPGLTKGADNRPVRLLIPPEIKEVRLELDVPGVDQELMARVEILLVQNRGRKLVWSREHIPSVSTLRGRTVLVALKPEDLASGDYIAYVGDSLKGPGNEPLLSYVFSIVRP